MRSYFTPAVLAILSFLAILPATGYGRGVYQGSDAFLSEVFSAAIPPAEVLWLTDEQQQAVSRILGHPYKARRIRYWGVPGKTAWILDEIGKEEPITTGIVIQGGKISLVRVLEYRESRGGEVRHEFFTRQFKGAGVKTATDLDRHIDGISGATLSVSAITRLASMALYLHGSSRFAP
jgi:hypothetical protein